MLSCLSNQSIHAKIVRVHSQRLKDTKLGPIIPISKLEVIKVCCSRDLQLSLSLSLA